MNYYFEDFTRSNYKELIRLAKKKYDFINYKELKSPSYNKLLWRHDVDISMHAALKLARIEADMGVKATYFIYPHSEFYNLFEKVITDILIEIKELGHSIGLHFDCHYYGIDSEESLQTFLSREAQLFKNILNIEVEVFSFHNTTHFTQSCEKESYAGLTNVYSREIRTNYSYCSDSNGYWKYRRLEDFLLDDTIQNAQVLTHPSWWQDEVMPPYQRIQRSVQGRADRVLEEWKKLLKKYGSLNIEE